MRKLRRLVAVLATCVTVTSIGCTSQTTPVHTQPAHMQQSGSAANQMSQAAGGHESTIGLAVKPKALSNQIHKGLAWLVAHQLPSGGWGQGDEAPAMRQSQADAGADAANVADTSMALLALMRAGNTPAHGEFKDSVRRGLAYVIAEIEGSDADSLYVTNARGTRVQSKIGTYVDTFTGLIVLTEAKGKMATAAENQRLERALNKVLAKVEKNQRPDGTWDNQGWAPVLTQSMASKGLNRAAQAGADVDDETLARVEKQAQEQVNVQTGSFGGEGSAGIELYAGAAQSSALRDSVNTRKTKVQALEAKAASSGDDKTRSEAQRELEETRAAESTTDSVEQALIKRLKDPSFISGFGNNGGEEFLSYMLVSESLVVKGNEDWKQWDENITKLINSVQNGDGSWTGHHCITGRTFCTATALLVLMADRTPVPMAAQIKGA